MVRIGSLYVPMGVEEGVWGMDEEGCRRGIE